jgi:hypothetical protein
MEPQAHPLEPWGKLSRDAADCIGERSMHPLYDHMLDVAACFLAAL